MRVTRLRIAGFCVACAWLWAGSLSAISAEPDFERQIAPILTRNCLGCHHENEAAGKLDLSDAAGARAGGESGAAAIAPGNVAGSYLIERIRAGEMPPAGKGTPLSADEVATLTDWVAAGAVWPDKSSTQPV